MNNPLFPEDELRRHLQAPPRPTGLEAALSARVRSEIAARQRRRLVLRLALATAALLLAGAAMALAVAGFVAPVALAVLEAVWPWLEAGARTLVVGFEAAHALAWSFAPVALGLLAVLAVLEAVGLWLFRTYHHHMP